jgi:signal transduction histidine kinase
LLSIGQLLQDQHNELTSKQRTEVINHITESSRETFNLLNNLLQWTQSETGELENKPQKIDINQLIQENVGIFRSALNHKNIALVTEFKMRTTAQADKNMINTVIRNLLSNAIKFTPEKGIVNISTKETQDNFIEIEVSDNGIGIEEKLMSDLFNLNSMTNNRGTNNESGTGLGLKLCKEFVEKNNGQILVSSIPNKGSTFTVLIPSAYKN